jgi:isopentenyl-diphosphate delta-isomerase
MPENKVILVDDKDAPMGFMEKMEAHQKALLHRAVSVFLVNSKGEWILQKRASNKYHSKGLWTNTCCTHPFPGESEIDAANRRLMEEMGMCCELQEVFSFIYREKLDNGLTEHEFDHVFIGQSDAIPLVDPDEVAQWAARSFDHIHRDILENPSRYTVWFRKIYQRVNNQLVH